MKTKYIILLIALSLIVPFAFSSAAGLVPCSGSDCTICHLIQLGQNLLTGFIKYVLVFITLFLIIWAGFLIITDAGNNKNKIEGINLLKKTLIGTAIILLSWTIINTIVFILAPNAVGPTGQPLSKTWNKIECSAPTKQAFPSSQGSPKAPDISKSTPSSGTGEGGGFSDGGGDGGGGSGGGFGSD